MGEKKEDMDKRVDELNSQINQLSSKVDRLTEKMSKIESNSETMVKQAQTLVEHSKNLVSNSEAAESVEIMKATISDPCGFMAKEVTEYLFDMLAKYESTEFRRWLAARGAGVVEKSIASFVQQKVPQLNWYGANVREVGKNQFIYSAKTSFPFEINTGIPFVGRVSIAKVVLDVEGKVNSENREVSDIKTHFSSEQPQKEVYMMFEKDLIETLKPHKTAYAVLSPLGKGVKRVWLTLKKELAFSIPLLLFFLATLVFPIIPPGSTIYYMAGGRYIYFSLFGYNATLILMALLNGVLWGALIWLLVRLNAVRRVNSLISRKPRDKTCETGSAKVKGGARFKRDNLKLLGILALVIVVVGVGAYVWWSMSQPSYPWLYQGAYGKYNGTYTIEGTTYTVTQTITVQSLTGTSANWLFNTTTVWDGGNTSDAVTRSFDFATRRFTPDIPNYSSAFDETITYHSQQRPCRVFQFSTTPTSTLVYLDRATAWVLRQVAPLNGTSVELNLVETNIVPLK